MTTLKIHRPSRLALAALAALTIGAWGITPAQAADVAPAAPAAAAPGVTPGVKLPAPEKKDVTVLEIAPNTTFINGGIGAGSEQKMREDAAHWPLRMVFSERKDNEFIADVPVEITNKAGKVVLRLKDAGPMTYVQVPQGEYHITATFKGRKLSRVVHVAAKGADVELHWKS